MTTREALQAARDLISDEGNWCQGDFARDNRVCAAGAIGLASGARIERGFLGGSMIGFGGVMTGRTEATEAALSALAAILPPSRTIRTTARIAEYNDSRSHACVLQAFDAAIEATP